MDGQTVFNAVILVLVITCYVYIYISNKVNRKLITDIVNLITDIVNEQLRHNKVMGEQFTKIILDANNKKGNK